MNALTLPPLTLLLSVACSPRAVTPPARTFGMQTAATPDVGELDVQIDASRVGAIFGPEAATGGARVRHAVAKNLAVEVDTGLLHITNDGRGGTRNAHTGRLGVVVADSDQRMAVGAGVGGGHSAVAGKWGTVDVGGVITGKGRHLRPVIGGTIGYGAPLEDRTFTVVSSDGMPTTLQLPRNTFAQLNAGVEIGPRETAFLIGLSMLQFWRHESDVVNDDILDRSRTETFMIIGVGLRLGAQ